MKKFSVLRTIVIVGLFYYSGIFAAQAERKKESPAVAQESVEQSFRALSIQEEQKQISPEVVAKFFEVLKAENRDEALRYIIQDPAIINKSSLVIIDDEPCTEIITRRKGYPLIVNKDRVETLRATHKFMDVINVLRKRFGRYYLPLDLTVKNNSVPMTQLLLENKADAKEPRFSNPSLVYQACKNNNLALVKLLVQHNASVEQYRRAEIPLHAAVNCINVPLVSFLLACKADVHACDSAGLSALYYALKTCYKTILEMNEMDDIRQLLISHGARAEKDVFFINADITPAGTLLHEAVNNSNVSLVDYLLESKADPNKKNSFGVTPLALALKIDNEGISSYIMERLLDHGADVNGWSNSGANINKTIALLPKVQKPPARGPLMHDF